MRLLAHTYLANLIIDELADTGKLRIADVSEKYTSGTLREPFPGDDVGTALLFPTKGGVYPVPDNVKNAILDNREHFRGGASGCDTLPDIFFSRSVVHPADSGIWLEFLFERFGTLPEGKEKEQAYAFLLGMMTHYAADMFVHAHLNEYAGRPFSEKHLALEELIDNRVTGKMTLAEKKISIPTKFLASCFADIPGVERRIGKITSDARRDAVLSAYRGSALYRASKNGNDAEEHIVRWTGVAQDIMNGSPFSSDDNDEASKLAEKIYGTKRAAADIKKNIEAVFGEKNTYERLYADLKDLGKTKKYPYGEAGEYKAFSLALTASKLCLLGAEGLNGYLGKKYYEEGACVPHTVMSWLPSLDGDVAGLQWETDAYAVYRAAASKEAAPADAAQGEFTPGLLDDLLTEEYDDVPGTTASVKETAVDKNVLETVPAPKDPMKISFDDPYVRKRDRVLPSAKKPVSWMKTEKKEESGAGKEMSDAMDRDGKADADGMGRTMDKKDSSDTSGKKDDAGMEKTMGKEPETPKKKENENDKTMDGGGDGSKKKKEDMDDPKKKEGADDTKKKKEDMDDPKKKEDADGSKKKKEDVGDPKKKKEDMDDPKKKKDGPEFSASVSKKGDADDPKKDKKKKDDMDDPKKDKKKKDDMDDRKKKDKKKDDMDDPKKKKKKKDDMKM